MRDGEMPEEERMPDLGDGKPMRIPIACQIDLYGNVRRMCVENYDVVKEKYDAAERGGAIELKVISSTPFGTEIVRWTVEAQLINSILEVTPALDEKFKKWDEEREKERDAAGAGGGVSVFGIPGPGFRLG